MKRFVFAALFAASALVASTAAAEDPAKAPAATPAKAAEAKPVAKATTDASKSSKDIKYEFGDDPLQAGVSGVTGYVIKVRPPGARDLLTRPRTHFIPELLKAVENL